MEEKVEKPTLDEVYKQFNVEATANEFVQNTQQQQPPPQNFQQTEAPINVPDPISDPDGFKQFVLHDQQNRQSLSKALQTVSQQLTEQQQKQLRSQEEADIKQAVDLINEDLKADPDFVEIALGAKARKDPRFLKLYENRAKQPDAWKAALKAYAGELEGKFSFRSDPQLAENQRAMRTSQQAMATGAKQPSQEDQLGSLDINELNRRLDQVKGVL